MRWVDVVIVLVVLASGLLGLRRGLVVQLGGIIGALLGLYVASQDYVDARNFLANFFHRDAHLAVAAYILVVILVWTIVVVIAQGIRAGLRFTPFGMLDKIGGAAVGLFLGVLTVEILLLLAVDMHDASLHDSIRVSQLAPMLRHAIPGIRSFVPKKMPALNSARPGI